MASTSRPTRTKQDAYKVLDNERTSGLINDDDDDAIEDDDKTSSQILQASSAAVILLLASWESRIPHRILEKMIVVSCALLLLSLVDVDVDVDVVVGVVVGVVGVP